LSFRFWHILERGVLAPLEHANVGSDGPAVSYWNVVVAKHTSETVRHHIEKVADGG
jgi:hypothetical protein